MMTRMKFTATMIGAGALAIATSGAALSQSNGNANSVHALASAEESEPPATPTGAEGGEPSAASAYDFQPEPDLPAIPPPPALAEDAYPDCRDEHEKGANYLERADLINACTVAIDTYYLKVLLPHREAMIAYQNELSRLYVEDVSPNNAYSEKSKNSFYEAMMRQHARANPDGALMAQARAAETRYYADRARLEDRFCYNTGCSGYTDPVKAFPAEVQAIQQQLMADAAAADGAGEASSDDAKTAKPSRKERKAARKREQQAEAEQGCKRARKRGSALGSFLGGAAGAFGGFGRTGSALLSGFSGLMVGEIACQLDKKEQEEATKATVTVLEAEEVGATAEWTSPTRQGVSGSSTVTALNTEPNGRRCLTITDVAIIDGSEIKVEKQMCKAAEGGQYMLVA